MIRRAITRIAAPIALAITIAAPVASEACRYWSPGGALPDGRFGNWSVMCDRAPCILYHRSFNLLAISADRRRSEDVRLEFRLGPLAAATVYVTGPDAIERRIELSCPLVQPSEGYATCGPVTTCSLSGDAFAALIDAMQAATGARIDFTSYGTPGSRSLDPSDFRAAWIAYLRFRRGYEQTARP
jgi:hypothetical protein